jgi:hypothetical protein
MPVSIRGDPFKCTSAILKSHNTNEDHMREQRPGTFKKGHKKLGGRKTGTPNRVNQDLVDSIVNAAGQVGSDGKGKDGVDGWLQTLAGKKTGYFVGLFRQAVQKRVPATEPEKEVVYSTEQEYRQALLDRGVHPTLLPPLPRDPDEKPPAHLAPPKAPPGWEWVLCKTKGSADLDKEQADPTVQSDLGAGESAELDKGQPQPTARLNAEEDDRFLKTKNSGEPYYVCPWAPIPGWRWEYNPYTKAWFAKPANSPPTEWS